MSSADEASVHGDGFSQEGGKPAGARPAGRGAPRSRAQGLDLGPPRSGEGEGSLPDPEAYELELEAPWEEIQAGRAMIRGHEGRPGSLADEKGDALDFVPHLAVESVAVVQQLTGQEHRGTHRYPSPESFATELSAIWADAEAGFSARGSLSRSCVEVPQASAAPLSHPSGPEGSRAWGKPKRGTKSRVVGSGEAQQPSSDPESSDELSEIQLMRSKHSGIGKRSMAKKTRESQPVAREDNDPNRDAVPQAQLPTQRPGSPGLGMHRGEFGSGDPSTNNPQSPGSSQLLDLSPGDLTPRGPATSGDQEPAIRHPFPERQQQPPGAQGCPRVLLSLAPRNAGPS
ncbi:uncharacterized protein CXorf49-like [Urocitellus parryii]